MIAFDPAKNAINLAKHGLALSDFVSFDGQPIVVDDDRKEYGERRLQAFGRIDGRGYCPGFTPRGNDIHLISFRRAHAKEMRRHEKRSA